MINRIIDRGFETLLSYFFPLFFENIHQASESNTNKDLTKTKNPEPTIPWEIIFLIFNHYLNDKQDRKTALHGSLISKNLYQFFIDKNRLHPHYKKAQEFFSPEFCQSLVRDDDLIKVFSTIFNLELHYWYDQDKYTHHIVPQSILEHATSLGFEYSKLGHYFYNEGGHYPEGGWAPGIPCGRAGVFGLTSSTNFIMIYPGNLSQDERRKLIETYNQHYQCKMVRIQNFKQFWVKKSSNQKESNYPKNIEREFVNSREGSFYVYSQMVPWLLFNKNNFFQKLVPDLLEQNCKKLTYLPLKI